MLAARLDNGNKYPVLDFRICLTHGPEFVFSSKLQHWRCGDVYCDIKPEKILNDA